METAIGGSDSYHQQEIIIFLMNEECSLLSLPKATMITTFHIEMNHYHQFKENDQNIDKKSLSHM